MTEKQIRDKMVQTATAWLGCKESNGTHKQIIDLYNSHKPLARNYKVKYTDAWCDTFASAVAIKAGMTDIIATECGCENHITLFKNAGCWVENDAYTPQAGDYIFYDWDDTGAGDNTGHADHVGIVVSVSGKNIKVIEGNKSNAVGYRTLSVNARYIRGYGVPKYASKATTAPVETAPPTEAANGFSVGDTVMFTGCLHYTSSYSNAIAKGCKAGLAKITQISAGNPHPYHLQAVAGKGATVFGWTNANDVQAKNKVYTVQRGDTLSKIAAMYHTTVNKLAELNGISNPNFIKTGQIIKLP